MIKAVALLLVFTSMLTGLADSAPDAAVCVLFDLSQSAQNVRGAYMSDFSKIVDGLAGGELILGSGITANSLASGRFEVNAEIPKYNPFTDSKLTFRGRLQKTRTGLLDQARRVLAGPAAPDTDLIGAMQLAEKALRGSEAVHSKVRFLIVFSDMIEESGSYNFRKQGLSPALISAIIEGERKSGRIPDLKGVQVWVAGAGGSTPEQYLHIQDFWIRYFQAAGADLRANRYGAGLMDFSFPSR